MPRAHKGEREPLHFRVPSETKQALERIKELTGQDLGEQLAPLVIEYARRALPEAEHTSTVLFEEPTMRTA